MICEEFNFLWHTNKWILKKTLNVFRKPVKFVEWSTMIPSETNISEPLLKLCPARRLTFIFVLSIVEIADPVGASYGWQRAERSEW